MNCPECNGKGEIVLFTSVARCDHCCGRGQVGDVRLHPAVTGRMSSADPVFGPEVMPPMYMLPRLPLTDLFRPNVQRLSKKSTGGLVVDKVPALVSCDFSMLHRKLAKYFRNLTEMNDA